MTTAVVVGSGSAGRRHATELARRADVGHVVVVRRHGTGAPPEWVEHIGAVLCDDLASALAHSPALGVVASPSPRHVPDALALLEAGATVLVEKPLAHRLDATDLVRLVTQPLGSSRVVLGYHLRFGDVAPKVRRVVESGTIGAPVTARFDVGQHLADWRTTDPFLSVSARAELGGGAMLELSHELDAVRYVLGDEITAVVASRVERGGAPTDGVVDTVADLNLRTGRGVEVQVHLDMVSRPARRTWVITGDEGELHADLLTSTVRVTRRGAPRSVDTVFPAGERDRAEERLIDHLLAVSRGEEMPECTLIDGLAVLTVIAETSRSVPADSVRVPS